MTGEVSNSMRLGVLTVCMAGFLGSALPVLITGLGMINSYGDKTTLQFESQSASSITSLAALQSVSGPSCYRAIEEGIGSIEKVIIKPKTGANKTVYNLNGTDDLMYILTNCTTKNYRVKVDQSATSRDLVVITLEEVN